MSYDDDVIGVVKKFCFDSCILSGHNPKCVDASIFFLYNDSAGRHVSQTIVSHQFGITSVSLRNNVKKIKQSEHWNIIKVMLYANRVEVI